jgi:hypothetical protein
VQPIDTRPSCDVDHLFSNGLMCKPSVKVQGVDTEHIFLFWWHICCGCTTQLTLELHQNIISRYQEALMVGWEIILHQTIERKD